MNPCPCKDCEFRHPGCHGDCEAFKTWKHPLELMKEDLKRERLLTDTQITGAKRRTRWFRDNGTKKER